ncbi:MAG: tRNA(Met) cytidine acetate ligase [Saccharofermentanales bacterium]
MIAAGIVCEYNPFHNGHMYQIEKIRERFGADCAIIAVMSGNFVQRGEAAMLDKWSRTQSALACGVSLVIELPAAYATGSAERFADGGVALAAATGICDYLVFGSESGEMDVLDRIAETLAYEPDIYRRHLKEFLGKGLSFPAARVKALESFEPDLHADEILNKSNNILAIEYLKALKRRGINHMKPFTIKREGQGYKDTSIIMPDDDETNISGTETAGVSAFWSASAIRASLNGISTASLLQTLSGKMPVKSLAILADRYHRKQIILSQEIFADIIFSHLYSASLGTLNKISGMNEGLGARLKRFSKKNTDIHTPLSTLINDATSKRIPASRIARSLLHMYLGIRTDDLELFDQSKGPLYLRILGFDKKGRYLLKKMKSTASLPILMNGSDFLEYANNPENKAIKRMAEQDCAATDIWMIKINNKSGQDFTTPPVSVH